MCLNNFKVENIVYFYNTIEIQKRLSTVNVGEDRNG
jgi:hypothetical protein